MFNISSIENIKMGIIHLLKRRIYWLIIIGNVVTSCAPTQPFGMAKVEKGFYVDDTEITVGDWLEFLYSSDLSIYENYNYKNVKIPDLNNFKINANRLPYMNCLKNLSYRALFDSSNSKSYYLSYLSCSIAVYIPIPRYILLNEEYLKQLLATPIVGISKSQALEFCSWRTQMEAKKGGKYIVSLLTKAEFDKINNENRDSIITGYINFNYNNFKFADNSTRYIINHQTDSIFHVASFYANKHFLYDVEGNVAEMVLEDNLVCGGSFRDNASEAKTCKVANAPSKHIGFRTKALINK